MYNNNFPAYHGILLILSLSYCIIKCQKKKCRRERLLHCMTAADPDLNLKKMWSFKVQFNPKYQIKQADAGLLLGCSDLEVRQFFCNSVFEEKCEIYSPYDYYNIICKVDSITTDLWGELNLIHMVCVIRWHTVSETVGVPSRPPPENTYLHCVIVCFYLHI